MENTIFVMECLAHVISNACKEVVMDVKYHYGRVDTGVSRRNMKRFTTWKKNQKRGQRLWKQRRSMRDFPVRIL